MARVSPMMKMAAAAARQRSAPRRSGNHSKATPPTEGDIKTVTILIKDGSQGGFFRDLFKCTAGASSSAAILMLLFSYIDNCGELSHEKTVKYVLEREQSRNRETDAVLPGSSRDQVLVELPLEV
ncbi:uncharacterized protein LOC133931407 isoform X2 [Phragmites australis]|nr:uncharacterized protein LOC133931407 isoform X2 [Phragmites australis]